MINEAVKFKNKKMKRRRRGTTLTFDEIYKFLKGCPFIHTSGNFLSNFFDSTKSILSAHELERTGEDEPARTFYIDRMLGLDTKVFFSFGINQYGSNTNFYLDPKKAHQLGYVQLNDVAEYWVKEFDSFLRELNKEFASVDDPDYDVRDKWNIVDPLEIEAEEAAFPTSDEYPDIGIDYLEYVMRLLEKKRMSVKEYLILLSYLWLNLAAEKKINSIEELFKKENDVKYYKQRRLHTLMSKSELQIKKEIKFKDLAGISLTSWQYGHYMNRNVIKEFQNKIPIMMEKTASLGNIFNNREMLQRMKTQKNVLEAIQKTEEPLEEKFEKARKIKQREGTILTFEDTYKLAMSIPFCHGTSHRNIKDIVKHKNLYSAYDLQKRAKLKPANTYYIDQYFKTFKNVFFAYGIPKAEDAYDNHVIFCLTAKKALKLGGYVQMNDIVEIAKKILGKYSLYDEEDFRFFKKRMSDGVEKLKRIEDSMYKSRLSVKEYIMLNAYLMLRLASHAKINNVARLAHVYHEIMKERSELHIARNVSLNDIDFAVITKKADDSLIHSLEEWDEIPLFYDDRPDIMTMISNAKTIYSWNKSNKGQLKLRETLQQTKESNLKTISLENYRNKEKDIVDEVKINLYKKELSEGIKSGWFIHASYSEDIEKDNLDIPKLLYKKSFQTKPRGGLWLTPKIEWTKWTIRQDFYPEGFLHLYKMKINPNANILHFIDGNELNIDDYSNNEKNKFFNFASGYDWYKFVRDNNLDGIYFDTYKNPDLLQKFYGLDVPSLVVFNEDAVSEVRYIGDYENAIRNRAYKNTYNITESPYDSPNKKHLKRLDDKDFLKKLRHEILARLFNNLKEYFKDDPEYCKFLDECMKDYAKSVKIIGGFLTRFAKSDSDIDVNVFLKKDITDKISKDRGEAVAKIHEFFRDNVNGKPLSYKYRYEINYFFLEDKPLFRRHGIQLLGDDIKKKEIKDKLDDHMVDVTDFLPLEKFEQYIFSPMKKAIKIVKDMMERKKLDRIDELKKTYSVTERVGGEIFDEFKKFNKELLIYNYTADNLRFKAMNEDSDFHDVIIMLEHEKMDKLKKFLKRKNWNLDLDFKESLAPQIVNKVVKK